MYARSLKTVSNLVLGVVLACVNLVSIIAGFAVYSAMRPTSQLGVQVPVAVLLSVALFALACRVLRAVLPRPTLGGLLAVYVFALLWAPAIFIPLHHTTQGYLTSAGNLIGLAAFQAPTNALVVLAASAVLRGRPEQDAGRQGGGNGPRKAGSQKADKHGRERPTAAPTDEGARCPR